MRWDNVIAKAVAALRSSTALTAVCSSSHIRMNLGGDHAVPSIEWTLIDDRETELYEPMLVQFDLYSRSWSTLVTMEHEVREVLHSELWRTLGGINMRSQYAGGRNLVGPEDGVLARSLDFEFEPFKERFAVLLGSET